MKRLAVPPFGNSLNPVQVRAACSKTRPLFVNVRVKMEVYHNATAPRLVLAKAPSTTVVFTASFHCFEIPSIGLVKFQKFNSAFRQVQQNGH